MPQMLAAQDPEIAAAIASDITRQTDEINLIASENYASSAVLEATGSVLTNKYAEGYPGRRYYAGCENADAVETLAIDRVKALFGVDVANVQPHSGSQANMAAYFATLTHGDRVLGMQLDQGGHLTHGSPVNFSGKLYEFASYGVLREEETIDYDAVAATAREFKPALIVTGATAYPRLIDFARFREIADEVGALLMVDMAHIAGLIAGGAHPSPAPYADLITSTTHKTLRGPRGAIILARQSLARKVNSAVFPNMQGGPMVHAIAAKAVAFAEAATPEFRAYAAAIVANAQALAGALAGGGLRIVSGGTDNHLMLVDVSPRDITGQEAEDMLRGAGIIANKNAIPFDPLPPRVTSGVRLGTPALTSRGMNAGDMDIIAGFILEALDSSGDKGALASIRSRVKSFASGFLVPGVE
ncbi:MAG TPA: serine hydroxymethyltransferase [Dehalococcoidia bacterium]|nr:serine hydroxymethyltransferase [Chloroflexota bacterium]MDP5876827.1 serine hydroxymethyltransferase [Dehalococcoidia bacterium]MDP7160266.1 serine hydroxymethyltransferase [Dehalococcoidia bacterium]MDP7213411.1 serine hydroxymethyltransferase [Dehalococcoidia bacterium]MDP7514114.1 serine hydroxymethyltransferase [Dehalococcoidia bacterium]